MYPKKLGMQNFSIEMGKIDFLTKVFSIVLIKAACSFEVCDFLHFERLDFASHDLVWEL